MSIIYQQQLRFYVYSYHRRDGTPYYIGKGSGKRAWSSSKRKTRKPKNSRYVVIVEANLTEVGALAIEKRLIRWYGRKDNKTGILHNRSDGGETPTSLSEHAKNTISKSTTKHNKLRGTLSEEVKNKISKSMKDFYNVSPDHKQKLSASVRLFYSSKVYSKADLEKAAECGIKARKYIQTPYGVAWGMKEATKISKLSRSSITRRLNCGCDGWHRLGESNSPHEAPQTSVLPLN